MSNPIRDVEIGMTEAEVRGVMGEADEVIRIKFSLPPREEHVSSDEYRNLIAPILAQIRAKEMYYGRSVVVLNGNGKVIAVE